MTLLILLIISIISSCSIDTAPEGRRINLITVALDYQGQGVEPLSGTLNDRDAVEAQIRYLCELEGTELRSISFVQKADSWTRLETVRKPGEAPVSTRQALSESGFKESIVSELEALSSDTKESDLNIFYYAGHGVDATEEEAEYLPLRGSLVLGKVDLKVKPEWRDDGNNLSRLMTTEELHELMAVLNGNSVIIMDSCYSGMVVSSDDAVAESGDIKTALKSFSVKGGGGREVFELSASRKDELSYETRENTEVFHGRFSKALVEAMGYIFHEENGEYPGAPSEKVITLGWLWSECRSALSKTKQTPQSSRSIEDIVLFSL